MSKEVSYSTFGSDIIGGIFNYTIKPNNSLYALAQCWKTIRLGGRHASCESCLNTADLELHKYCPFSRGAIVWMLGCLLKYSDANFIGVSDKENGFCEISSEFNDNPKLIKNKLCELFIRFSYVAVHGSLKAKGKRNNVKREKTFWYG